MRFWGSVVLIVVRLRMYSGSMVMVSIVSFIFFVLIFLLMYLGVWLIISFVMKIVSRVNSRKL